MAAAAQFPGVAAVWRPPAALLVSLALVARLAPAAALHASPRRPPASNAAASGASEGSAGAAPTSAPATPREPVKQVLHNADGHGLAYVADMKVGGQAMKGILDTGSYELLVFSKSCERCGGDARFYDRRQSTGAETHTLQTIHSFGSGDTFSRLAFDRVEVGEQHASRQYFWEVIDALLPVLDGHSFEAIIGVGPPSNARRDAAEAAENLQQSGLHGGEVNASSAVLQRAASDALLLVEQKTLLESFACRTFSVCLRRQEDADGVVVWHDRDPRMQPGSFSQVPVVSERVWAAALSGARLAGGRESSMNPLGCGGSIPCAALVDSGTSLLAVPTPIVEAALVILEQLEDDCTNLHALPNLEFDLGDTRVSMPPESYIGIVEGELAPAMEKYFQRRHLSLPRCELLMMTMDVSTSAGPLWILGMPFLREYYTTFELGPEASAPAGASLFVAPAGLDCDPAAQRPDASLLGPRQPRRVDLSKVMLPKWAVDAAEAGYLHT